MSASMESSSWYRVAPLKPSLRDAVRLSRHMYRGQPWYVLSNPLTGASHRFNKSAYIFISQLDGIRTVQEIWESMEELVEQAIPTQDDCIALLARLHQADLVQSEILPSTLALMQGQGQQGSRDWKQQLRNPFYLRLPLWNPDRFLSRWHHAVAPLLTRTAFYIWAAVVLTALVLVGVHWPSLKSNWAGHLLTPTGLLTLWLAYPLLKGLHELGHAFAVKHWGGEVHELGITLLAFTPVPYVNASASAAFADKRQRIGVAAMGMMIELFVASLAFFVWLNVENGLISDLAFNLAFIGGVSSLLFNGNPLLRYDGYYILSDLLEIPKLGQRANAYLGYLLQRYMLGDAKVDSPLTASGESFWFILYGPLAFAYRLTVMVGLVWIFSQRFFVVGILIAVWGTLVLLVQPLGRVLLTCVRNREKYSRRAGWAVGGVAVSLALLLFVVPMPLRTSTQGVVWLPEQSVLRAAADCEITALLVQPDQVVTKGTPLIQGEAPLLGTTIKIQQARLKELQASYHAQPLEDQVQRKIILDAIQQVQGDLQQLREQYDKLIIRSPVAGRFVLKQHGELAGRFAKQGEVLGYVFPEEGTTVRAVVGQADIGLVRDTVSGAEVRLAEALSQPLQAQFARLIPGADFTLPSAALGTAGGGQIAVDPLDSKGVRAVQAMFQLDLVLPASLPMPHVGGRVHVRLEHGTMPLGGQWIRGIKQLLLRKFYD